MRRSRRDGQGTQPRRGLARRAPRPDTRTDSEKIAAVAHDAHVPVEDVLREVADFRLALETDMIIAAAAADAESDGLLAEVVDGERAELALFQDRLLDRLADAAAADEVALRRTRRRSAIGRPSRWIAAAAAAAAVLTAGAAVRPERQAGTNSVALATASQQYADLSNAVNNESALEVRDAAAELHQTLQDLIKDHAGDPEVAQHAAQLLQAEISLLQVRDPDGASQVIAQARSLVKMLRTSAPPQVRATVAPILDAVTTTKPKPAKSTASPKPKASASPSPAKASASPSATPTPTQSKSASAEPEGGQNPLDSP
jgi:hypothetical protein